MMTFVSEFGGSRLKTIAVCVGTVVGLLALSASSLSGSTATGKRAFELSYPDLSMLKHKCGEGETDPCLSEATALAEALIALEAARNAAETAYDAWADCVIANGGGPIPNPELPPARTFSILETTR